MAQESPTFAQEAAGRQGGPIVTWSRRATVWGNRQVTLDGWLTRLIGQKGQAGLEPAWVMNPAHALPLVACREESPAATVASRENAARLSS